MSNCKHDWRLFGMPDFRFVRDSDGKISYAIWYCTKCRREQHYGEPLP